MSIGGQLFDGRGALPRARAGFLKQSIALEEPVTPGLVSAGIVLTTALILGGIGWAAVTPVSEVAHTSGAIIPAGRIHRVQHFEGGIVAAIHVSDGDLVVADEVLVELQTARAASERAQLVARQSALAVRLERLRTLITGEPWTALADGSPIPAEQRQLYEEQRRNYRDQLALIDAEREQYAERVRAKREQAKALAREVGAIREREAIHGAVEDTGVLPKVAILEAKANLARAESQLKDVEAEIRDAEQSMLQQENKRREFVTRWRQERRLEIEQAALELKETEEELNRLGDRLERLTLRAPVNGYVQGLAVNSINAVVEPGETVLEIVPTDDELVAETQVQPRDIGHVQPGQRVNVTVSSFEAQRFGTIDGSLRSVSATTYLDADDRPYYKAQVILAQNYVGSDPDKNRLLPGMTVTADIRTGQKTVLDYILKPVYRGFSGALHER